MTNWILMLALATPTSTAASATTAPKSIASLAFMSGCWQGQQGEARLDEHWLGPSGGSMLGVSRVVAGGRTVFSEFMEIREQTSGEIVMTVLLGLGQTPVAFKLVAGDSESATFENPAHDFPQRVRYWKQPGLLAARIEGQQGGVFKSEDFQFARGTCQ
jgi:hypothetical protein